MDVPIMKGDVQDIMQNNLFHVFVDHSQNNYEVQELEIILKKRNIEHTKSLTFMKYVFVFATLLATVLYYKSVRILCLFYCYRFHTSKWKTSD